MESRRRVVVPRPRPKGDGRHRAGVATMAKGGRMGGKTAATMADVDDEEAYDEEEVYDDEEIVEGEAAPVPQQSLFPSVSDPALWMFSCPTGKEVELVYQIMNKCVAFAKRGKPLGITSVVIAQTKGKIYVESHSEPAVIEAVQGVRGVMVYSMTKVPISDMTTVMTVVPKKVPGGFISGAECDHLFLMPSISLHLHPRLLNSTRFAQSRRTIGCE